MVRGTAGLDHGEVACVEMLDVDDEYDSLWAKINISIVHLLKTQSTGYSNVSNNSKFCSLQNDTLC